MADDDDADFQEWLDTPDPAFGIDDAELTEWANTPDSVELPTVPQGWYSDTDRVNAMAADLMLAEMPAAPTAAIELTPSTVYRQILVAYQSRLDILQAFRPRFAALRAAEDGLNRNRAYWSNATYADEFAKYAAQAQALARAIRLRFGYINDRQIERWWRSVDAIGGKSRRQRRQRRCRRSRRYRRRKSHKKATARR